MASQTTARQSSESGEWSDCYVCREFFGRKRVTSRFCSKCDRGYCEGEHGSTSDGGLCIICRVIAGPPQAG